MMQMHLSAEKEDIEIQAQKATQQGEGGREGQFPSLVKERDGWKPALPPSLCVCGFLCLNFIFLFFCR
jgi:hypothetical protein